LPLCVHSALAYLVVCRCLASTWLVSAKNPFFVYDLDTSTSQLYCQVLNVKKIGGECPIDAWYRRSSNPLIYFCLATRHQSVWKSLVRDQSEDVPIRWACDGKKTLEMSNYTLARAKHSPTPRHCLSGCPAQREGA
jgi:hypothetical protein